MKPVVVRNVPRASADHIAALAEFGVATVHEAMGRLGLMKTYMRPVYPGAALCGTAVTVLLQPGDNWMMHVAAEHIQAGDVVVAACTSDTDDGDFGELLATAFRAPGATVKTTLGSVNVPIVCAGISITPGDVVIGDTDGVVVVPAAIASQVADASEARESKEREKRAQLATGVLGLDLYKMRDALAAAGLKYLD